ncbi:MAG: histidine kinase dimerization/phospho-acceptor domain-containing protein [Lachnospiraceae bacterium]
MLINDESCNSEKTILRQQENGIIDLLGSDWYGIMLLSPGGRVYLDTYNDVHGIGNDIPLRFVENCVRWESLLHQKTQSFEFENAYFFIYSIRQTDKGNCVFFLHCRTDGPFNERDIKWYELYSRVGHQRVLLENELIQEKNYLTSILESSEGCIAVVDPDYNVISSNDEAKEVFGDNLKKAPAGEMLTLMKAVDKVLSKKEKLVLPRTIFNGKDNELGFSMYKFVLTPLRNSKEKVGCVVIVATDITQTFINKRLATQKQHFKLAGNMTFDMIKDIRTPLMNIQGCASLLMDSADASVDASEETKELLTFIKEEVNHIRQINDQMVSFYNITGDNTYGQIDVNDVLQNCVSALHREHMKRQLTVEIGLEEGMPLIRARSADLQQMFFNLLLSSIDGFKKKGKIYITSHFEPEEKAVVVEITSDGEGDQEEEKLYLQLNANKNQGWIDIPLLLAKKIVVDCGGKLETGTLENRENIRRITLPCIA